MLSSRLYTLYPLTGVLPRAHHMISNIEGGDSAPQPSLHHRKIMSWIHQHQSRMSCSSTPPFDSFVLPNKCDESTTRPTSRQQGKIRSKMKQKSMALRQRYDIVTITILCPIASTEHEITLRKWTFTFLTLTLEIPRNRLVAWRPSISTGGETTLRPDNIHESEYRCDDIDGFLSPWHPMQAARQP